MIVACLSWYDEPLEGLTRCVSSLAGVADVLLAVDGCFAHYPAEHPASPPEQHEAIRAAASAGGVEVELASVDRPWDGPHGGEVAKRAWMMERAAELAAGGWCLVIDGDELVEHAHPELADTLAAIREDVAFTGYHVVKPHDSRNRQRRLYRALPGLTVRNLHWRYMVGDRVLWGGSEPTADLSWWVTLLHTQERTDDRQAARSRYYVTRNELGLERV